MNLLIFLNSLLSIPRPHLIALVSVHGGFADDPLEGPAAPAGGLLVRHPSLHQHRRALDTHLAMAGGSNGSGRGDRYSFVQH